MPIHLTACYYISSYVKDVTLSQDRNSKVMEEIEEILIFYPRDAMLALVIGIATCLSVRPSVFLSRAGIVSKRRKLAT